MIIIIHDDEVTRAHCFKDSWEKNWSTWMNAPLVSKVLAISNDWMDYDDDDSNHENLCKWKLNNGGGLPFLVPLPSSSSFSSRDSFKSASSSSFDLHSSTLLLLIIIELSGTCSSSPCRCALGDHKAADNDDENEAAWTVKIMPDDDEDDDDDSIVMRMREWMKMVKGWDGGGGVMKVKMNCEWWW